MYVKPLMGETEGKAAQRREDREHRTVPVKKNGGPCDGPPFPRTARRSGGFFFADGCRAFTTIGRTLARGRMAIPKVMGIETEYGITVKNQPDFNPILSSLLLINSYETYRSSRVRWDYEAESPLRDARGFEYMEEKEGTSKEESRLINLILSNGARFYVDHAHPEYSSPETTEPARLRHLGPRRRAHPQPGPPARRGGVAARAADHHLQGQLRPEGQLLRHPRELPDGPQGAVRADRAAHDAVLRDPPGLHRRRQGRLREQRRGRASTRSPSGPTSSRPRSGWRPCTRGPS